MRYLIDEHGIEPVTSLALYRTTLTWAAERGERFVLYFVPEAYDDPDVPTRLRALGTARETPSSEGSPGVLGRLLGKLSGRKSRVEVEGHPDQSFVREMTEHTAPAGAVAGDVSPVEDLMVFAGDRTLYASYDYGRTQVLDMTDEELVQLRQALERSGLDPERVVAAPPYVTGSEEQRDGN